MANFIQVYRQTAEYAKEKNELFLYRESRKLNGECAAEIDRLIAASDYELYRYDLQSALKSAIHDWGLERVSYIVAATIKDAEHDGRYSKESKMWAKSFGVLDETYRDFYLTTHPAVLDGFAKKIRDWKE